LSVGPTTTSINGAEVSLSGKTTKIKENWAVVDVEQDEIWIPLSSIIDDSVEPALLLNKPADREFALG